MPAAWSAARCDMPNACADFFDHASTAAALFLNTTLDLFICSLRADAALMVLAANAATTAAPTTPAVLLSRYCSLRAFSVDCSSCFVAALAFFMPPTYWSTFA